MVRNNVRLGSALNYFAVQSVAAHVVAGVESGSLCVRVFVCKLDHTRVKFGSTCGGSYCTVGWISWRMEISVARCVSVFVFVCLCLVVCVFV